MIDHLCVAQTAPDLTPYETAWDGPNPVPASIDGLPVTFNPVSIIRQEAIPGTSEEDPGTPAVLAPGYWFVVRSRVRLDLPDFTVVTITDSDRALAGEPFILFKNDQWPWETLTSRVSPLFAGDNYPFGPDIGPHLLAPPEPEPEPTPEWVE